MQGVCVGVCCVQGVCVVEGCDLKRWKVQFKGWIERGLCQPHCGSQRGTLAIEIDHTLCLVHK